MPKYKVTANERFSVVSRYVVEAATMAEAEARIRAGEISCLGYDIVGDDDEFLRVVSAMRNGDEICPDCECEIGSEDTMGIRLHGACVACREKQGGAEKVFRGRLVAIEIEDGSVNGVFADVVDLMAVIIDRDDGDRMFVQAFDLWTAEADIRREVVDTVRKYKGMEVRQGHD